MLTTKQKDTSKKTKRKNSNKIGAKFEERIEKHCEELDKQGIMKIHKIPTEIKMIRGCGGKIVSAYPVKESNFVDYQGILKTGQGVAIETKTHCNKTSFSFNNIQPYQVKYLEDFINKYNGSGWYIIEWREFKRVFLIPALVMSDWIENLGRKSVPLSVMEETEDVIELDYNKLNFEDYIK